MAGVKDQTSADRARLAGLVLAQGWRRLNEVARGPVHRLATRRSRVPLRLLIAPQDIRTADPTVAADIYSGYFVFDGKAVNTRGASPFELLPPSDAWAAALAGFGWLRHLRAADTSLARFNGRALVNDWIAVAGRPKAVPAWRPDVVARRLLAWLSQSPLILDGADAAFYRRFMRSLARQTDFLKACLHRELDGSVRLVTIIALTEVALCAEGLPRLLRRASRLLADELGRQILADGGHVGRNPSLILDLLLDLLPLRQSYAARGVAVPPPLLNAIDRMMPMVRTFRLGDGSLAAFNGMGVTRPDMLATVLAYDDARGLPLANAPYSGYQRLESGGAVLVVDSGGPPPPAFARAAHAGTLAFELSVGAQRVVLNCGAAPPGQPAAVSASRATAAHSTLVLADASSGRFVAGGRLRGVLYAGPRSVTVKRNDFPDHLLLELSHDGYARRFGYVHHRGLGLAIGGHHVAGEDRLVPVSDNARKRQRLPFAIRFHLHHTVRAALMASGTAVRIAFPSGETWVFDAREMPVAIEESIFFANAEGPRRIDQIVIHGYVPDTLAVTWSLYRENATRQED